MITIKKTTFKELIEKDNLPSVLYKYRDWNDEYHKKALTENQIYFAAPSKFNDPLECKIPFDWDEENIYKSMRAIVKKYQPNDSEEEIEKSVKEEIELNGIFSKERRKEVTKKLYKEFDERLGVLSLTHRNNSKTVWKAFANKGKGFCIGFDTEKMFSENERFTAGGYINYYPTDTPSSVYPIHESVEARDQSYFTMVFSLRDIYEKQQEYRVIKTPGKREPLSDQDRLVTVLPSSYKEIYLGLHMSEEHKKEIIEILGERFPHIKAYQMTTYKTFEEVAL